MNPDKFEKFYHESNRSIASDKSMNNLAFCYDALYYQKSLGEHRNMERCGQLVCCLHRCDRVTWFIHPRQTLVNNKAI